MSEQKKSVSKKKMVQHKSGDKDQDQQTEEDDVVDVPADFDELFKSERIKKLFNKMLDQKVEAKLKQHRLAGQGNVVESQSMRKSKQVFQNRQVSPMMPMMKSPSDTMIYTPAFRKAINTITSNSPNNRTQGFVDQNNMSVMEELAKVSGKEKEDALMNRIANFIETIRMSDDNEQNKEETLQKDQQLEDAVGYNEAKKRADAALLEAEKFKVTIVEPNAGKICQSYGLSVAPQNVGAGLSDDDFFHLTCHIDPTLMNKIEKGEFVELQKLLPKDKKCKSDDSR